MTTRKMKLVATTAALSLGATAHAGTATLSLSSPLDYEVVQRHTATEGVLHLKGKTSFSAKKWQYRLLGTPKAGKADESWHEFPGPVKGGAFDFAITVPAGGWYRLEVRGVKTDKTTVEACVEHVGVGEVFIVSGQSNAGNYGAGLQVTKTGNVGSFNGEKWALANDPQQGSGGWDGGGSFMPAFGDAMNERFHVPIGIVGIAEGGTSVREWLPKGERMQQQPTTGANVTQVGSNEWESTGKLFDRFVKRFAALGPSGFRAVLWHQGESDAGQARSGCPADRQITGDQYFEFMVKLINATREKAGWPMPWVTAQTTYHSEQAASDDEFRAAMKKLWDKGISIEGPDTDTLRAEYRDGVHFNAKGLQKHGQMWADKVGVWLDKQLACDRKTRTKADRILFLGNSITLIRSGPNAVAKPGEWAGNWGLTATAEDKDYVHILARHISGITGRTPKVMIENIAEFERGYETYNVEEKLKAHLEFKADTIVLAIAENVPALESAEAKAAFQGKLTKLLKIFKENSNPVFVVRSSFWPNEKDEILKQACEEIGGVFVDISGLGKDESNYARSEAHYNNPGVGAHPGDKGMNAIADALFEAMNREAIITK